MLVHNDWFLTHEVVWYLLFGSVAGLLIGAGTTLIPRFKKSSAKTSIVTMGFVIGFGASFILSCATEIRLVRFDPGTVVLMKSGANIILPDGGRLWKDDPRLAGGYTTCYYGINEGFNCEVALSPITANPKVRRLSYTVPILQTDKGFSPESAIWFARSYDRDCKERVLYWLCEFNERHSKELALFYNPYDPQQQKRFDKLIRQYLEPLVKKEWRGYREIGPISFEE